MMNYAFKAIIIFTVFLSDLLVVYLSNQLYIEMDLAILFLLLLWVESKIYV